ncbi:MAG: peptidase M64 [Acidobacteria bacterium]|nr:peptidase M64 [Acidobacteriota bacterium]
MPTALPVGALVALAVLTLGAQSRPAGPVPLRTMRVDYFHTGNTTEELFALDRVVVEPAPWPGPRDRAGDVLRYGAYGFDVTDAASGRLLYSRGFGSIYDEWVTTEEAATSSRTFHESLRFPLPASPVVVGVRKRGAKDSWTTVWETRVDPAGMFVDTAAPEPHPGGVMEIERHGDSATQVDLLLLGDGYTTAERGKFRADAQRLVDVLFATSPFKERRQDFNVWGLVPPARESGISRPSLGQHRANPVGSTYDAFGSERYVLTFDNRAFRQIVSYAPYDVVEIVVNGRTYGGGGIYNLYSTVAADNAFAPYVFVHEFGHHFAALADEYYTSPVAYLPAPTREEPWEPNVTALLDPATLKWKDLVRPSTPLPTPWEKDAYETRARETQATRSELRKQQRPEAEMEALFARERRQDDQQFAAERFAGRTGAFEGARYEARGYYRPAPNCIMFTRTDYFCDVCRRALNAVIDTYVQ